ncbi:hypothetical protein SAMN04487895_11485 [Paenibacillus sophorae]|uniref:Uncharacterized protein n=1 Tax=Paenibacillus sophorae TaxID=1333845 RepID=A0A1H8TKF1_9BACL|nr:hypothetical protein [Paenibacillus sophorae]QWU16243.1 hypothetical protein KP014_02930 [Paenibacillus sophorae]SEO90968.1 hypothetical protein SAMN04487895_11485 [Paenibacillus sophorae]
MDIRATNETDLSLAIDILADMIVRYLRKQAPPLVRAAVLQLMEWEEEERLAWEMTADLLGTADFQLVS